MSFFKLISTVTLLLSNRGINERKKEIVDYLTVENQVSTNLYCVFLKSRPFPGELR